MTRNRYYDSSLSTWISRDPIGYKGGFNLYEYCSDDPLDMTDPSGLLKRRFERAVPGNAIAAYNVYWTQFTLSAKPHCKAVIIQHVTVSGSNNLKNSFGTVDYYEWIGPTIIQPAITRTHLTDHWSYGGDKQFPIGHSQITTETVIQRGKATAYKYTDALKAVLGSWGKFPAYPFGNTTWSSGSYPASRIFNAAGAEVIEEEDMEHVVTATWDVTRTGNKTKLTIDK